MTSLRQCTLLPSSHSQTASCHGEFSLLESVQAAALAVDEHWNNQDFSAQVHHPMWIDGGMTAGQAWNRSFEDKRNPVGMQPRIRKERELQ